MPVKLSKNVFGNPKSVARYRVADAVESKGLTKATRRATAVSAARKGAAASSRAIPGAGGGRPGGADWYRVEDVNIKRNPVTDTLVRTPVTDRQIVEHRGMSAPLSTTEVAKMAGGAAASATAAHLATKAAGKIAGFALKRVAKNLPVIGPAVRLASVGRTAYKLTKAAKAGQKLSKAQAVRALITSAL